MSISPQAIPQLAPPGAGIPALERIIGGAIFTIRRWSGSRDRFAAEFGRERAAIASMCQGCDEPTMSARVLIPRLRGLEDSSRYWSVRMTLDHLRIVNDQITGVIDALTSGRQISERASTAAVKPSPDVGADVVEAYERSCDRFVELTGSRSRLHTPVRYAHPWFGQLDGAGWHAMAAMHMGIHRAQISRILMGATRR